jgi:hypothetical protein
MPSATDWGELYPSSSDSSELRRVTHVHGRILERVATRDDVTAVDQRVERLGASIELQLAVARAQVRTTLAVVAAVWGVVAVAIGVLLKFVH